MITSLINIYSGPYSSMRYPTCGDWYVDEDGRLCIQVVDATNDDYNFLLIIHELVESYLCLRRGISQEVVDDFDFSCPKDVEPGDHPDAPYKREHCFATGIERLLAAELGVDWTAYEHTLDTLVVDETPNH